MTWQSQFWQRFVTTLIMLTFILLYCSTRYQTAMTINEFRF